MILQANVFIGVIFLVMSAFFGLNGVITMPIIFNFFIIPKIEKKTGKKLEFAPYWNAFLFGNFIIGYAEIVEYIIIKYFALRFKKNPDAIRVNRKFALEKIKYDIRTASNFEIKMSFIAAINVLLAAFCLGMVFLMKHLGPS